MNILSMRERETLNPQEIASHPLGARNDRLNQILNLKSLNLG